MGSEKMVAVLIIDPDITFCQALSNALHKNYNIYFAHSAEESAQICKRKNIDIAFITLGSPAHGISSLISELRDMSPETRVIALSDDLTDHSQIAAMIRIGSLGVNQFVSNPLVHQHISKAVDDELANCVSMV